MAGSSTVPGSDAGNPGAKKTKYPRGETPSNKGNNRNISTVEQSSQAPRTKHTSHATTRQDAAIIAMRNMALDSFEEALPILPRGFVGNTAEVYREVASFDIIPPEKLREYWRVYTVTHRKLYDPTANRLENFWWHVWGSKRRNLSGKTVARLFENISTGPTFVPLRTPTSRYDGPTIPNYIQPPTRSEAKGTGRRVTQQKLGSSKPGRTEAKTSKVESHVASRELTPTNPITSQANTPSTTRDETTEHVEKFSNTDVEATEHDASNTKETQQDAQIKMLSSSSSRPAPAQSILRKPRPSFSGPRPTPRFALPSGEPSEKEEDEEGHLGADASANDDATTSSVGSGTGSADINRSDQRESQPPKPSSSSSSSSKASSGKRDGGRLGKGKAAKKKFVVNSSASKRRTFVSKRSGSHGSQSSAGSEGLSSREPLSHLPPRHSGESLIEEEGEDDIIPTTSDSPSPDQVPSTLPKRSHSSQPPTMTAEATGKQPIRPQPLAHQEQTPSPASESTAVSSSSGSVAGSVTGTAMPGTVPGTATRGPRSSFAQQVPGVAGAPGSLASSGGSSGIEMPMGFRNRQTVQRPSLSSATIPRPGGGLIRQSTMPYEVGQSHRQQVGRGGSSTAISSARGLGKAPPTSAYMGPSFGGAPGVTNAMAKVAPQMGRSMSQDSYGSRPRLGREGYQSPILGPVMRSGTIASPSMVAASGVFMDADGPDPFELYAKTGLDEPLEDVTEREQPSFMSENGSYSSSYQDLQPVQRPLFTPTRPAQTPRIPFARTRSQLNVILDREKERLGEGSYASWQESRGTRDQHEPQGDRERSSRE